MPALLTRMSRPPSVACVVATRSAISAGLVMSAGWQATFMPLSPASSPASLWSAAPSPSPFTITLQPAPAKARAMARPIPLVDPVTSATLPLSDIKTHFLKKDAAAAA